MKLGELVTINHRMFAWEDMKVFDKGFYVEPGDTGILLDTTSQGEWNNERLCRKILFTSGKIGWIIERIGK